MEYMAADPTKFSWSTPDPATKHSGCPSCGQHRSNFHAPNCKTPDFWGMTDTEFITKIQTNQVSFTEWKALTASKK